MAEVGDKVSVRAKGGVRLGVIKDVTGTVLRIAWENGEETRIAPAAGTMTVLRKARAPRAAAAPATKAAVAKKSPPAKKKAPAAKKAPAKKAVAKKAVAKKAPAKKAPAKKRR